MKNGGYIIIIGGRPATLIKRRRKILGLRIGVDEPGTVFVNRSTAEYAARRMNEELSRGCLFDLPANYEIVPVQFHGQVRVGSLALREAIRGALEPAPDEKAKLERLEALLEVARKEVC